MHATHDLPRFTINRDLIILLPKQPVVDWLKEVAPMQPDLTLDQLRREQSAYLVYCASSEGVRDVECWVYSRWRTFFKHFINEWCSDESRWPQELTLETYREWFDVQHHSMVWDLTRAIPIDHEDWV